MEYHTYHPVDRLYAAEAGYKATSERYGTIPAEPLVEWHLDIDGVRQAIITGKREVVEAYVAALHEAGLI